MTNSDPKIARLALVALGVAKGHGVETALDAAHCVNMQYGQPVPETAKLVADYLYILEGERQVVD